MKLGNCNYHCISLYRIGKKCFKSQTEHGLQQEEYDLITKTDDYSMRSKPSADDIQTLQAIYKGKCICEYGPHNLA